MGFLQARETERRQQTPATYQESAKAAAQRACVGREPADVFECVYEHAEASQQTSYAEQDLSAQQRAASAALIAAVIAFLTLVVTAIGVFYVRRTLDATLEAVEDTSAATKAMNVSNDIAKNAQRPWIKISAQLLTFRVNARQSIHFDYQVEFENVGQMVAVNTSPLVVFRAMGHNFLENIAGFYKDFEEKFTSVNDAVIIPGDVNIWRGQVNQRIDSLPWDTTPGHRKDCHLGLIAFIRYRLPGEDEWHYSMQTFVIGEYISAVDDAAFRYDFPINLRIEDLTVRKFGRSRAT